MKTLDQVASYQTGVGAEPAIRLIFPFTLPEL